MKKYFTDRDINELKRKLIKVGITDKETINGIIKYAYEVAKFGKGKMIDSEANQIE